MLNKLFIAIFAFVLFFTASASAQTSAFVFQGKLNDGGIPANGTYQFTFTMYDASAGGNQIGQTITDLPATVTNGIFAVNLDFGANAFDGAARFIEVGVRMNGTGQNYTILNPRQAVTSTPYAVKSLKSEQSNTAVTADNSLNLGGIAANQYVITNDSRLSDARNPLPDSPNYIQNTINPQLNSNFNISGEGKAGTFNVSTNYKIGGSRVFHLTGTDNTFIGFESGNSITSGGGYNAFFGTFAGKSTTTGLNNSFFGAYAGRDNVTGGNNAFFGANTGLSNRAGFNSFFGSSSGINNFNGSENSFFGANSGAGNTNGLRNSFFGRSAGEQNTIGNYNSFFGYSSGSKNIGGDHNSFFGNTAGQKNTNGYNNSFFGSGSGSENTIGNDNVYIGISAGGKNVIGSGNVFIGGFAGASSSAPDPANQGTGDSNTYIGYRASGAANITNSIAIGAYAYAPASNTVVIGNASSTTLFYGKVKLFSLLGNAGITELCRNAQDEISTCSSSIRYKFNIQNYTGGLDVLKRLRPVTFNWKSNGAADVGFVAEEVNAVEPLLSNYNEKNEVEGVKYSHITTVLVNSIKEQQTQIEKQNEQIKQQQSEIEALKILVCASNQTAAVCQPQK